VYLETTIVSYLTAKLSNDLIVAGHQKATLLWWEKRRLSFEIVASQYVVEEASRGDLSAAQKRISALSDVRLLDITEEVPALAARLVKGIPLPKKAGVDAAHIAVTAVHGIPSHMELHTHCECRSQAARGSHLQRRGPPMLCHLHPLRTAGEGGKEKLMKPVWEDPIVAEVRRARDEIARAFNYDIAAISDDARRKQALGGHEIVRVKSRALPTKTKGAERRKK
jgi:hypothetical protein